MATETKTVIWQIVGKTVGMGALNTQTNAAAASMAKLALRAAAVIPLWVAMRAAIFALPRAISAATKEWLTFQSEMSRVATVTRTTAEGFKVLEDAIVDSASKSKVSFKDTASVVYALGSAGLTASQQLAGFNHVIDLAVGTGGNLEQTAKLVSGAVNVFGKSLKDATTEGEKFKKVADIIAFTYSTQQVELAELATALGYVASVGTLVKIEFEELVATLGVLNTGMLKGSKSGTSLVNAFIQLARKSDRLGELGIKVDTSKPLDFLKVMEQLVAVVGSGELSVEQLSTVMRTFGIRGGRAVGLLINNWEAFQTTLDNTKNGADDFAEIMRRMAEDNIPAQARKIRDSFTGIWKGVLDEVKEPWMNFLKRIFNALERFRTNEQIKKLSDKATLGDRLKSGGSAAGIGVGALILGRGITPAIGLNERVEAKATQLAEAKTASVLSRAATGAKLSPADTKIATEGAKVSSFRLPAARSIGAMNTAMVNLGGSLKNTAKFALLAYGGLKIFQGIMNSIAPDAKETAQLNDAVKRFENGMATFIKGFIRIVDFISAFAAKLFYNLVNWLQEGFKPIVVFFQDTAEILKAVFSPLVTIIQYLRGEISGIQAAKQLLQSGPGLADVLERQNNQRRVREEVSSQAKEKTFLEKAFAPFAGIADALGYATAGRVGLDGEDNSKQVEERRLVAFHQAIQPFLLSSKLARENDPLAEITRRRADIARDKEIASVNSGGITDIQDDMTDAFKLWQQGAITGESYAARILVQQAKLDDTIGKLPESIAPAKYKKEIREAFGVTGRNKLLSSGNVQAIKDAKFGIVSRQEGAPTVIDANGEEANLGAILTKFDADIKAVIANNQTESLKLFGVSDEVIEMKKFETEVEKFIELKQAALGISKEELGVSDFLVENSEKLRRVVLGSAGIREDIVKLQEKGLAITRKQLLAVKETGSYVKDAFKGTFKDIFETGNFDFSMAADKFGAALKTAWQDQFSDIFADVATNITGLDTAFGGIMTAFGNELKKATSPIAQAHIDGIGKGVMMIINAHETGIANGMAGKTSTSGTAGKIGGIGGMIGGFLKQATGPASALGKFLNTPLGGGTYTPQGGTAGSQAQIGKEALKMFKGDAAAAADWLKNGGAGAVTGKAISEQPSTATTYGQAAGVAFNSAVTGFSTYEAAGGSEGGLLAGLAGIMGGVGGLAMGASAMTVGAGATSAALLGAAAGPVGWIGLGLAAGGMLLGAFNQPEKPSFRNEEVREQTTQIASRIDITNNSLEWVNRNLVEMRQELTYIMRESFYFSEKSETERFAIDAQRGVLGG